ncbi:aminotransferase, putative [Talaromyces stipitatus ATCC 10500]|uniref:Aminotransferase, putative n=1 Tax=Talaromyces stipitatus (strain ATCC 10500 / CBS 375.48 / QM 6759 / NRRL 1006) TaxID=441959 RepID=B8M067_TALSN|nr:aminotransferase, putative [Talaromyces stipitatus ATCC 10500]EED21164.1 aminotransferase, putative [Talaromyces stipitatus ATCC 10500]
MASSVLYSNIGNPPTQIIKGEGHYLLTEDGLKLFDATSGAAVAALGHNNPEIKAAIVEQLETLDYCYLPFFTSAAAEKICSFLTESTGGEMSKVFIVSSGTEAVEASLKMARQYFVELGQLPRTKFIARKQSYHGNTLGSLATGFHKGRRAIYEPILAANVSHVSPCYAYRGCKSGESDEEYVNRLAKELEDEFQSQGPDTVCAFIAETVSGTTLGCVPPVPGYFKAMREVCDRHGALLILDEVMSGMGRTGTLHAWQQEGVVPDLQTIAKGLGAGFVPIGALMLNKRVVEVLSRGSKAFVHSQTYQGHPVACAAALAVQNIVARDGLLDNVKLQGELLGKLLQERLSGHKRVGDIRGRGLLWGIEFVKDKTTKEPFPAQEQIGQKIHLKGLEPKYSISLMPGPGIVDGKDGDIILIAPPYTVSSADVKHIVNTIAEVPSGRYLSITRKRDKDKNVENAPSRIYQSPKGNVQLISPLLLIILGNQIFLKNLNNTRVIAHDVHQNAFGADCCYECSRRRIDCDRQQPTCQKCETKGLACSGLDIRYRFNGGLASRGKLVGKSIPTILSYGGEASPVAESSSIEVKSRHSRQEGERHDLQETYTPRKGDKLRTQSRSPRMTRHLLSITVRNNDQQREGNDSPAVQIGIALSHVDGKTQYLMQYFAEHIAPAATVINRGFNGFRDLLLPYAETDPFVRGAIAAVSRQHIILRFGGDVVSDIREYNSLIIELVARSKMSAPNQDISSLIVLLLLHYRETISGGNGFKYLYGSLKALPDMTIQSNLAGQLNELTRFVNIQILRLRLFAEPLFDEADGKQYLSLHRTRCFEFLRFCQSLHPEYEELMDLLFAAVTLACEVYVRRACFDPPSFKAAHLIENFRQLVERVKSYGNVVGQNLLAWPFFVMAAESSTLEDREFFLNELRLLYEATGYRSALRGVETIRNMWQTGLNIRWTSLLGGYDQFLIM